MDTRSEACLEHVEPDLVRVIRAASQTPQAFEVTYGLRTEAAEAQAVRTGHSETMHSRHLPDQAGLAAAIDFTPLIDGEISFCAGHEAEVYGQVVAQIKSAARSLGIAVEFGAEWTSFKDWGHVQLPWSTHP